MKLTIAQFKKNIVADLLSRGQKLSIIYFLKDPISRFHWYLRLNEYFYNRKFFIPIYIILKFLFLRLSQRLGFSIPINTLGKGVYLPHWGTIVINSKSYIGDYSVINVDVVIGRHPTSKHRVPTIGKSVYIAPGVKIFGDICIGDFCIIGANSVVTKSYHNKKLLIGIPAKINQEVTKKMLINYGLKINDDY